VNPTTIKTTLTTLLTASLLLGCSSNTTPQTKVEKVGFVVTINKNNIHYKCGNKEEPLTKDGKFSCDSFPIGFYRDSVKIGSISSLHHDGYVFPQDMQLKKDSLQTTVIRIASR
jgi:PBP1b-binding outer membrane lipoprotein LpoB